MTDQMAGQVVNALQRLAHSMEQILIILSKLETRDANRDSLLRGQGK
jgi:hypothetical protein